jgi:hypothetical protein
MYSRSGHAISQRANVSSSELNFNLFLSLLIVYVPLSLLHLLRNYVYTIERSERICLPYLSIRKI